MKKLLLILVAFSVLGCSTSFLGYPAPRSTITPNADEIAQCRRVMYIQPDLQIKPLGFFLLDSIDDIVRFKFIAMTDDPASIFDPKFVDPTAFRVGIDTHALQPNSTDSWWDLSKKTLTGGRFVVPPPGAQGSRGLNIGYTRNQDKTITVYVLWHET
jgi:hypothetical protein